MMTFKSDENLENEWSLNLFSATEIWMSEPDPSNESKTELIALWLQVA